MFHYKTLDEVKEQAQKLGIQLPFAENTGALCQPLTLPGHTLPNRMAIHPMEGCDGTPDGKPDQQTLLRYDRFARSGAGLIWLEAVAVCPEGRANPRQLWINEQNLDAMKSLVDRIRELSVQEHGFAPLLIMQATHSGRYSKPQGTPAPIIAYNNPLFEKDSPLPKERIITDDRLKSLEEEFGRAAALAEQAGFDGVDIKCCHRYLNSELLSAYTRPGAYGGSFENRTRLLRNSIASAKAATGQSFLVTSRLNIYDGFPYPYGFGVSEGQGLTPCMEEPIRLVKLLHQELGLSLLNITIGNPYVNPHVNRPADGLPYESKEDPLTGVARMLSCTQAVQQACPDLAIIGSGLSYLRQYAPLLAAGGIQEGYFTLAGFGRQSFAYPEIYSDILAGREISPKKTCISCGKCSELMRAGQITGCVIRDPYYTKLYQETVAKKN